MSIFSETFVSRGVERQYSASSAQRAKDLFATSCRLCSTHGKHLECHRCGISEAHNTVMTILFSKGA